MFRVSRAIVAACLAVAIAPSLARGQAAAPGPPGFSPPRLIERAEPRYPEEARRQGAAGTVLVQIVVDRVGTVTEAKIAKGAGYGFDEAALEAARKLRFEPATQDGLAISVQLNYEIHFQLTPELPTLRDVATPAPAEPQRRTAAAATGAFESTVEGEKPFTAASARTVRDRDFLLRPRVTPEDILRVVPGLVLAQHQGGGKADQLFLRGFDADHGTDVSVNLDGIPVNMPSHAHGQGFADLHFLIPEAIERIEVVKGPYEAQYGDFDTAGAVNLVSREKFDQSQVSVQGGVFPSIVSRHDADGGPPRGTTYRVLGIAAPQMDTVHPWFAAEVYGTQGPFLHGERLGRYNLFAKSTFELSPAVKLSILGMAYASSWIGSGQIPARLVDAGFLDRYGAIDPTEGGDTQRQQIIASLHAKAGDNAAFTATASFVRYGLTLFNDFTFQAVDPVHGDEIEQDDRRTSVAANLKYERQDRSFLPGSFYTTLGVQLRNDDIDASLWKVQKRVRLASCLEIGNPCVNTNDRQTDAAAYVQLDFRPARWARLVLGLRHDLFEFDVRSLKPDSGIDTAHPDPAPPAIQRSITSPKASLVVTPVGFLDLFFNFGDGFHSNDARSVVETGGAGALPRAIGYEVGARARLFGARLDLAAALWRLDLASELVWSGDDGGTSPSDPTRRQGVDLEARYQILPWLFADLDVSLAKAQFRQDFGNGKAVALAPSRIITGGLTAQNPSGFSASLRVRHIGPRPGSQLDATSPLDPGNPSGPRVPRCNPSLDANDPVQSRCYLVADGYTVFDLVATYTTRRWGVSLLAENLTNMAYREAQFGNVSQIVSAPAGTSSSKSGAPFVPESHPIQDIHYTPGNPFGIQLAVSLYFQ
jgi:TonB family protein